MLFISVGQEVKCTVLEFIPMTATHHPAKNQAPVKFSQKSITMLWLLEIRQHKNELFL